WTVDRRFAKVLDLHSRGRETLWGYACPSSPVDSLWRAKAIQLSQASGYGSDERPPSADGEHFQWQFAEHGAMSLLTETHDQFQPPYASAVTEAAAVWGGVLWLLDEPLPLTGRVTDGCSGLPLAASLTVQSLGFTEGEVIRTSSNAGRFHGFLPSGNHSILVEAPGFLPATVSVQVPSTGGATLDVQLDPVGGGER
ncbi:carboxypeptidase regulatory-like domain-containing protein, partial [Planctomycetota bacterium]|nr:carboxypeptidase regulatory-like domain-containing protein [Planctomycetota bacterium]